MKYCNDISFSFSFIQSSQMGTIEEFIDLDFVENAIQLWKTKGVKVSFNNN